MNPVYDDSFFRMMVEEDSNIIFVKDAESRFIFANRSCLNLFSPEARARLIGSNGFEGFSAEEMEGFLAEDRLALSGSRTQILEEIVDYQGVRRTLLTRKIGFTGADGAPLLLGISSDVTELAEKEKRLVEMNRSLENFAALAAHDLRSPLHTFVSCIEMIRMDAGNVLTERSAKLFDMMQSSAHNLGHQISSLLMTYKPDTNLWQWAMTDLNLIMREVRFNLSHEIEISKARVLNDVLPNLVVNRHLMRQLFHNLIENGIKYAVGGRAPLIVLKAWEVEGGMQFSLEDNGRGIKNPEAMFDLFSQGEKSHKGVGLGLALCSRIVEQHRGRIWADRNFTDGARICFFIPTYKA